MAGTSAYVERELISGVDVKTVQGESIVGTGNLDIIGNVNQYADLSETIEITTGKGFAITHKHEKNNNSIDNSFFIFLSYGRIPL